VDYGDDSGSCRIHQVQDLVLRKTAEEKVHQTEQDSLWVRVMYYVVVEWVMQCWW
jgi:hypothetical protein